MLPSKLAHSTYWHGECKVRDISVPWLSFLGLQKVIFLFFTKAVNLRNCNNSIDYYNLEPQLKRLHTSTVSAAQMSPSYYDGIRQNLQTRTPASVACNYSLRFRPTRMFSRQIKPLSCHFQTPHYNFSWK